MNAKAFTRMTGGLGPQRLLAALVLAVAGGQGGCCCFDCIPHTHHTAPLKYIPPISAVTPRNPPCSYVDPMCYGYHATCWRPWPAECVPDCVQWYQHDSLGPHKGEVMPPLAPMPPTPEPPAAPEPAAYRIPAVEARSLLPSDGEFIDQDSEAPAEEVEVVEIQARAEAELAQAQPALAEEAAAETAHEATELAVEQATGYATLPPIIAVRDVPPAERLPPVAPRPHSSRRAYQERQADAELP